MKKAYCVRLILVLCGLLLFNACAGGYNKYADDYYEQGLVFYNNQEYERSVENFSKVLELAPHGDENNKVYYNRGQAYFKSRQYDKAIYDFSKSLEMTPRSDKDMQFDNYYSRGNAWLAGEKYAEAIDDFSKAIQLRPKHKDIEYLYDNRAWAHQKNGQPEKAIVDFRKALEIDTQFARAYYGRGFVWFKQGDYERALFDAKEAHRLKPEMANYDELVFKIKSAMK